jgi:hypothetical protein
MAVAKILRWFISRLVDIGGSKEKEQKWVSVTVSQESEKGVPSDYKKNPESIAEVVRDDVKWWTADDSFEIEGTIQYDKLLNAISQQNIRKEAKSLSKDISRRALNEGMVFLQLIEESDLNEFYKVWSELKESRGLPNAGMFLKLTSSRWHDFTAPAREMSSSIYRQLLGAEEVGKDEN